MNQKLECLTCLEFTPITWKEKVMVQRYRPDELEMIGMHPESDGDYVDYADYTALERERDELQAKVIEQDDKLCKAEKRLEVACHVKADDKVGLDFAVLDKIDSLERERDELKEAFAKGEKAYAELSEKYFRLEQENALLRKRLELATDFYWTWANDLPELDVMNKAIDFRKAMELKEGE